MGRSEPDDAGALGVNWSLESVTEFVLACYDRDTILEVLLGYSAHWFPASMVLIVGREWVQLFASAGFELPQELTKGQRRGAVDGEAPAVTEASSTGTASEVGLAALFEQLELGEPLVRTVGVRIGARVAIVVVGKIRDEAVDTEGLEAAATAAGRQLEDVIRMAKLGQLPPQDERIPPVPKAEREHHPPGSDASDDSRATLALEGAADAISTPVLSTAEQSDDEIEVANPNATSFGLPFAEAREAAEALAAERAKQAEDAESADDADEDVGDEASDSYVSEPRELERFPDIEPEDEESSAAQLLEDPVDESEGQAGAAAQSEGSGVAVVTPHEIRGDARSTQIGGLQAEPVGVQLSESSVASPAMSPAQSEASEASEVEVPSEGQSESSVPQMDAAAAGRTQIGGLNAEVALIQKTLDKSDGAPGAVEGSDDGADGERGPHGEWVTAAQRAGSVPAAMILRPARGGKVTPVVRTSKAAKSTKPPKKEESASPAPSASDAPARPADSAAVVVKPKKRKKKTQASDADVHQEPTRVQSSLLAQAEELAAEKPDGLGTGKGWARRTTQAKTRKFADDEDVDDAWFDYFGDEESIGGARQSEVSTSTSKLPAGKAADAMADLRAQESPKQDRDDVDTRSALNFSLSEPSEDPVSIPAETFDRLLDSGPEMVDLQEQFIALDSRDKDRAFEAANQIAELGEKALEALDLMFPGRIFLDRYQYTDDLPPVDQHGPLLHALVRLSDIALPVVQTHLNDASNEARFYAVFLLSKMDAEPVLEDLFDRLFDRDQQTRRVAADLIMQYQMTTSFGRLRGRIRDQIDTNDDVRVTVAARLLGKLRDLDAVERLISAMDESATPRVKLALLEALTEITLHHWSTPYEWSQWWKQAKGQTRQDWIVDALDTADSDLRHRAYDEVQRMPGLQLNYHPDQPSKLRKRAQKELRQWFADLRG